MLHYIFEAAILAASLSLDAFTAGFAYGASRIKIPMVSVQIINLICSAVLGISLFAGALLKPFLPHALTLAISCSVLLVIGFIKLLHSAPAEKQPETRVISPLEAAALAISLSFDGIAIGFGAALADVNALAVFLWSLITDVIFILLGQFVGRKLTQKLKFNVNWLSGIVLIGLALSKLL